MENKMKFHHVGIACGDIDEGVEFLKSQFDVVSVGEAKFDENQNATLCMVAINSLSKPQTCDGGGVFMCG